MIQSCRRCTEFECVKSPGAGSKDMENLYFIPKCKSLSLWSNCLEVEGLEPVSSSYFFILLLSHVWLPVQDVDSVWALPVCSVVVHRTRHTRGLAELVSYIL